MTQAQVSANNKQAEDIAALILKARKNDYDVEIKTQKLTLNFSKNGIIERVTEIMRPSGKEV